VKLERLPTAWRMTLHPLELATIISTLRWVTENAEDELPADAMDQLQRVLHDYDTGVAMPIEGDRAG
jgi:hypothetical protein